MADVHNVGPPEIQNGAMLHHTKFYCDTLTIAEIKQFNFFKWMPCARASSWISKNSDYPLLRGCTIALCVTVKLPNFMQMGRSLTELLRHIYFTR